MNKQIEEMEKDVCLATQQTNYKCNDICEKRGRCAYCKIMAEALYNTGYRKPSEGELNKQIQELTLKSMDLRIHQHFDEEFAKMIMRIDTRNNNSKIKKQSEGEWSRFEINSSKGYGQVYYQHKDCDFNATQLFPSPYHFCPNCGAKMKGGKN